MIRKFSLQITITEELECHDNCNDGPCCLNGGKCTENKSGNICICPHRYMGQYCEIGKLVALKYINICIRYNQINHSKNFVRSFSTL